MWLDVRGPTPRLFAAELTRGTSTASLIATFAPSLDPCHVFLDGALAGAYPALRDGCVLTFCADQHLCRTEPLASLFDGYPALRALQFPFKVPICILALREARRAAAFGAVRIQVSVFEREFLFRLAADSELRLGAVGTSSHYATVAICSPSWGVCFTDTENRVSPSASRLRGFIQDVWPEHSSDRILDTGEFFGDATLYIVTRVARPLVMWIRADPSHHDVLWLPPEVRPEDGIPCPRGFHVHVFRNAGTWGLYDFRAGSSDGVYSAYSPSVAAAAFGSADLPSDDLDLPNLPVILPSHLLQTLLRTSSMSLLLAWFQAPTRMPLTGMGSSTCCRKHARLSRTPCLPETAHVTPGPSETTAAATSDLARPQPGMNAMLCPGVNPDYFSLANLLPTLAFDVTSKRPDTQPLLNRYCQ